MAEKKPRVTKTEDVDKAYYIVNPAGAVHSVSRAHARQRLAVVGWRLASAEEIATYRGQPMQRWDAPIANPWSPDPDAQLADLPE